MRRAGAKLLLTAVLMPLAGQAFVRDAGAQAGATKEGDHVAGGRILGTAPTYSDRKPGSTAPGPLPNEAAIDRRIWVPGLDDGYVPQGLTFVDGSLYVGSYRSADKDTGKGPCRVYRIDPDSGKTTGQLDLPQSCGHAGGLARGTHGRLWVADTRIIFEIALSDRANPALGQVIRSVALTGSVTGSFAAGTADALWLGRYDRQAPGRLWRFPFARIGASIGDGNSTHSLEIPSRAQGAAFDGKGQLWITRSGATLGELVRLDPATGQATTRFRLPDGVEDLSFDGKGRLWTLSEAGSRRWLGWATYFPILFRIDRARLR